MFAKYVYLPGSTNNNIVKDLAAIIGGLTNKALLSANCNQANTEIFTTYEQSGWTISDPNAGVDTIYLQAPQIDFGTKTTQLSIAGSILTLTALGGSTYSGYMQTVNTATGGTVYISANRAKIFIISYIGGVFGNGSNTFTGVVERIRGIHPHDTVQAAYGLNSSCCGAAGLGAVGLANRLPSFKNSQTGIIGWQDWCWDLPVKGNCLNGQPLSTNIPSSKVDNGLGTNAYLIFPLSGSSINPFFLTGNLSASNDFWYLPPGWGNTLDEIDYNGKTYILFTCIASNLNSSGMLLLPKG